MMWLKHQFSQEEINKWLDMAQRRSVIRRLREDEDVHTLVVPIEEVWAWNDEGYDDLVVISARQGRFIIPMDDLLEADGKPITLREYKS